MTKPLIGISAHKTLVTEGELSVFHHVVTAAYVKAVRKAGAVPVLLPMVEQTDVDELLDRVDALVMTGGGDVDPESYGAQRHPLTDRVDPERDAHDIALCRAAVRRRVPTLAICRGSQVLNVALGGTLDQHVEGHFDVERYNEGVHGVSIDAGSDLAAIVGSDSPSVNTLHHQSIDRAGEGARVVARAPDGTVEAIEVEDAPVVGVQWHPELLRHRPEHLALFRSLVDRAVSHSLA